MMLTARSPCWPVAHQAYSNQVAYTNQPTNHLIARTTGTVKQTLVFDEANGSPVLLDCNRDYLAAVTPTHSLRVFKVAGREAKPYQGPGVCVCVCCV